MSCRSFIVDIHHQNLLPFINYYIIVYKYWDLYEFVAFVFILASSGAV